MQTKKKDTWLSSPNAKTLCIEEAKAHTLHTTQKIRTFPTPATPTAAAATATAGITCGVSFDAPRWRSTVGQ